MYLGTGEIAESSKHRHRTMAILHLLCAAANVSTFSSAARPSPLPVSICLIACLVCLSVSLRAGAGLRRPAGVGGGRRQRREPRHVGRGDRRSRPAGQTSTAGRRRGGRFQTTVGTNAIRESIMCELMLTSRIKSDDRLSTEAYSKAVIGYVCQGLSTVSTQQMRFIASL